MRTLRLGLLAGLAGGLYLGVGGRAVMRLLALAAAAPTGFSLGGTAEVLLTGWLIGVPAAVLFVALRSRLPGPGVVKGALFGALVLLVLVLVPPQAARGAAAGLGHLPRTIGLFGALFLGYGIVLEVVARRLERRA